MSATSHAHHDEAGQAPLVGSLGVDSRKLGLWAFIGSETLFFYGIDYHPLDFLCPHQSRISGQRYVGTHGPQALFGD